MARPERDTDPMQRAFELRFQVYCEECGFLPSHNYPQRMESDAYDAVCAHACALNADDALVGYARLVRAYQCHGLPLCPTAFATGSRRWNGRWRRSWRRYIFRSGASGQ